MDYKSTLNLPKTSFPMKANLPQTEPKVLAQWEKDHLTQKVLDHRKGSPLFVLHDGPPYANGDIHIGHALNKILKDIIVRYQAMRGKRAPYVPGWDCHGLPIEYALMKELKVTKHQVDIVQFRKQARLYARKYVGIQREQFKRLGCAGDWENPYLTLAPEYVAAELRALAELVKKGLVYRARKPVNWCWSCETALAEAEVEYEQHASPSIYVKFALTEESARSWIPESGARLGTYLVIWTTTPWTLMGNVAVAVHPDFQYAIRRIGPDEMWITALDLPEAAYREMNLKNDPRAIQEVISGKDLAGRQYHLPFLNRKGQVVLADYVSKEEGTGLVHTAPGFGAEDFNTGKKYDLEVLAPVDSQGRFVGLPKEVESFNGKQVQSANPDAIQLLRDKDLLVGQEGTISHQYPHCWRCRNPIIFRATDQWFLRVDENLRGQLLGAVEKQVQWIPPVGRERMAGMIKTRPDWCLSRQRLWGVPIPAVTCGYCGKAWLKPEVIERFAQAVEKDPENNSDLWFIERNIARWLPDDFRCDCGPESSQKPSFKRGTDILDVWFDSGVSHRGVLRKRQELQHPADLYLEGSDQHRGWFQVSLITGVALDGRPPYRGALTHGFVVDGQGRKMSKSLGNVIAPQEVISSMGADVLRLWVASSDYAEDVRISPEILSQAAEVYRKIRNTLRFCLANLSGFSPVESPIPLEKFQGLNRWILLQLGRLNREVTEAYDRFAFHKAVKAVHEFCTVALSNFYLDVIKDRLYTSHPEDPLRRETQAVLAILSDALIRMTAPILPFTAEEAWGVGFQSQGHPSVHLEDWPDSPDLPADPALEADWQRLLDLRTEAMKALEKAREAQQIGDALEAELELEVRGEELWKFLESHRGDLTDACIVSRLQLKKADDGSGEPVRIHVRKAPGSKCQRCWRRLPEVGESGEHPTLCRRCVQIVEGVSLA